MPVRFPLPILTLTALVLHRVASRKQMEKAMRESSAANSRRAEEMRMRAVASGEAGSERGAQIIQYDPEKVFDPSQSGIGTVRPYGTKKAGSRYLARGARVDSFRTSDFTGAKSARSGQKNSRPVTPMRAGIFGCPMTPGLREQDGGDQGKSEGCAKDRAFARVGRCPSARRASGRLRRAERPRQLAQRRRDHGLYRWSGREVSTFKHSVPSGTAEQKQVGRGQSAAVEILAGNFPCSLARRGAFIQLRTTPYGITRVPD